MTNVRTGRRLSRWGLVLIFTYGTVVHFLMAWSCRWWLFRPGSVPGPAVGWLVDLVFATLGGSIFARLMSSFPSPATPPLPHEYRVFYAGVRGLTATVAALESLYVLGAAALGFWAYSQCPTEGPWYILVFLAFLDIQAYGLRPLVVSAPLGLVYGGFAGYLILKVEGKYRGLVREEF